MTQPEEFIILDPRRDKRAWIGALLSPLGTCRWLAPAPMGRRAWPQTAQRSDEALAAAIRQPASRLGRAAKRQLLRWQYNGARALFAARPEAVAVAWNGLNGTRRVFCQAARDAGARVLTFELAPLPGRLTVDASGVNAANGLPRQIGFYRDWFAASGIGAQEWRALGGHITQRKPQQPPADEAGTGATASPLPPLSAPFLFVPLQVPGDSQLRLFGGAYRTVEAFVRALCAAAQALPEGWHLRLKEHPSGPAGVARLLAEWPGARVALDNRTDTFVQVAASRGVLTVNSSVGLEAMWFDKPVAAAGVCFWALEGVARPVPDAAALTALCAAPQALDFDPAARAAFLTYLDRAYYPRKATSAHPPLPEDLAKIVAALGRDQSSDPSIALQASTRP